MTVHYPMHYHLAKFTNYLFLIIYFSPESLHDYPFKYRATHGTNRRHSHPFDSPIIELYRRHLFDNPRPYRSVWRHHRTVVGLVRHSGDGIALLMKIFYR